MPLYVKDAEVDRLAERVTAIGRISKTEAVKRGLRRELEHLEGETSLVERIRDFTRDLEARAPRARGEPVDKAFIDSLYE